MFLRGAPGENASNKHLKNIEKTSEMFFECVSGVRAGAARAGGGARAGAVRPRGAPGPRESPAGSFPRAPPLGYGPRESPGGPQILVGRRRPLIDAPPLLGARKRPPVGPSE